MKSKQAMFQHQLDDSKRRQLELEDKLAQSKQQIEELKVHAEAPTQDKGQRQGGDSEEVLQLHE